MANVSSFSGAMPVIPGGLVELGYSQIPSDVNVTSTTAGSGTPVISALTVVCDGGPILVEFFAPGVVAPSTAGGQIFISLYQDGSEKSRYWSNTSNPAAATQYAPAQLQYRTTPSAGSHTFDVRAFVSSTTGTPRISAGTSTTGSAPAFLRVSKIVNQNDGLKPFWTPPVVTSLPSQATEGDQVLLYSSSPYAGYQTHQYVTGSWRTLNDSRGVGAWQSYTPTVTQSGTVTCTTNYSSYIQIGKLVVWNFKVTYASGTGTAGNALTLTLPVSSTAVTRPLGSGTIYYNTTPRPYVGQWYNPTTTTVQLMTDDTNNSYWGYSPSLAFSSSTQNFAAGSLTYEAA